ncbi:bleomycin resistance protein [Bacillus velezensis]|nr:bleomycin resistance protein [Bacillus velezensis]ATV24909.1 VOC family protein [Bacillus sp. Lzh-5]MVZ94359.1 VOC family protein [Bacillus velezensis]RXK28814.1 bleomycin resistance protein [Bacillus velezensis]
MKPRITVITSGADNLEKSLHFYQDGLGLPTEGIAGTDLNMAQNSFGIRIEI